MKNLIASIFAVVVLSATFLFAQQPAAVPAPVAAPVADSVSAPAAETAVAAEPVSSASTEEELKSEISVRDSVMALRDSTCSIEKDSLKKALEVEQAKCANWEKSYNTVKQNSEVCAQALSVSIGVNEKKKEKEDMDRQQAAMMTSTAFMSGVGLGMLLFWLIFD